MVFYIKMILVFPSSLKLKTLRLAKVSLLHTSLLRKNSAFLHRMLLGI